MIEFVSIPGVLTSDCRNDEAHVIVCGNEKGGSGKSTTAIHIAIGLMKLGFRVSTVDLDIRQQTLSRHIEYRHRWMRTTKQQLVTPTHFTLRTDKLEETGDISSRELDVSGPHLPLTKMRVSSDFIVIDTPGSHTRLSAMAHREADTLVTPINDSFIDFDVLARVDAESYEIEELSQYALEVRDARRFRQQERAGILDWIVVRNRMAQISSRNEQRVDKCLRDLSGKLGFRIAHGIAERVIFREFFQSGLTALDEISDDAGAQRATMSHLSARMEVRKLIASLHLPIDKAGLKRARTRKKWLAGSRKTVELPEIFA